MCENEGKYCCSGKNDDERTARVKALVLENKEVKGGLIPILHGVQEIYGYLPQEAMKLVSELTNVPMVEIYGVVTFYHYFSLEPKGEHVIRVCMGTACYVKGGQTIIDRLSQELNVEVGKTTADGKFTLESTRCLGACGLSPVITVDDKVYGKVTLEDVRRILDEYSMRERYGDGSMIIEGREV